MSFEWIGYIAAFLGSCAFLPQVIYIWKTKSARDVSLSTYTMMLISQALWLIYGLGFGRAAVIGASVTTLLFVLTIIVLKIKFR